MAGISQQQQQAAKNRRALEKKSFDIKFELDNSPYDPIDNIGIGAYGVVCSALHRKTKEKVAIKKIPHIFDHPLIAKRTYREIKILKHFKHDNIIGIREILKPGGSQDRVKDVYIVFDLMESDLHKIIHSKQELTDEHVKYFLYQLLRGLKYIHSANVLHRDLKPGNILINENCDLKIGDFGMARGLSKDCMPIQNEILMTQYVATRWYRAPELIISTTDPYSGALDLWSVGCIFAEMLGRKQLFPGRDHADQIKLIIAYLGTPTNKYLRKITSEHIRNVILAAQKKKPVPLRNVYPRASSRAVALLERMLVLDSVERITVEGALEDVYLSKYHDPDDEPICIPVLDFSFDKQMSNEQLNSQIKAEIEEYHKPPPKLNFDFRPVPREEMIRSPGGSTHQSAPSGVEAFLHLAGNTGSNASQGGPGTMGPGKPLIGTFTPAGSQLKGTLTPAGSQLKGTLTQAGSQLKGTLTPAGSNLKGTFTPAGSNLKGTFAPAGSNFKGTLTPARPLIGTLTPAIPAVGTSQTVGSFAPVKPVDISQEPVKKEFKSPLAVKTENLIAEIKQEMSGNDIEMLSAKSERSETDSKTNLSVKTEAKPEESSDIEMLSAKTSHGHQGAPQEGENKAPQPQMTKLVNLCPPEVEPKPIDAKERLKAMLNKGARRQSEGGNKKKSVTAAQRQREREEARRKRKERAQQKLDKKGKKGKNSPKSPFLTEEDRGMLARWQNMQTVKPPTRELTPPKLQQPTVGNTGLAYTIVPNPVGLVPQQGQVTFSNPTSVSQASNLGQVSFSNPPSVSQDSNLGQVTHAINLGQASVPAGVVLTAPVPDVVPLTSQAGSIGVVPVHLPHVASDSSIGEPASVVLPELVPEIPERQNDNQLPGGMTITQVVPPVDTGGATNPATFTPVAAPVAPVVELPVVSAPPGGKDALAVNVTSAATLQTMTLTVTSQGRGDVSPDFVDKLLAGGSAGLGDGIKPDHQGSPLKPANMADGVWLGEERRLPSYTEAVQAKQGYKEGVEGYKPQEGMGDPPFVNFIPADTRDDERPFHSYVTGSAVQSEPSTSSVAPPTLPSEPIITKRTRNHGNNPDILSVVTKQFSKQHVDDLTLAGTPKGTGGGYGLGGDESMEMLASILHDESSSENLMSGPASAGLVADWMDIVGDMGDKLEMLIQQSWETNNAPPSNS